MSSRTEIANLALSHLGTAKRISNLETERGEEANIINVFFDTTLKTVLSDAHWPFAVKRVTLGLVEEDPTDEWAYSYQYPSDCIRAIRIPSGTRNDNRQTRVPYRVVYGASGRLIYSDVEDADLEYVFLNEDGNQYTSDFIMAFSLRLAAYIAPVVTGGDPFKMGERALRMYYQEISVARANNFNEQQDEEEPDSEFIRARN